MSCQVFLWAHIVEYGVTLWVFALCLLKFCLFQYTAIDCEGQNLAVAGRTGLAHYSMVSRKWKLFGNETQEKDFVVTGGLLWWRDHVVMGCYSILENRDEIRIYPRDSRLDNMFVKMVRVSAQVLLLNTLRDRLITFCASGQISIYSLSVKENHSCKLF